MAPENRRAPRVFGHAPRVLRRGAGRLPACPPVCAPAYPRPDSCCVR
ncbi:hypothetical protein BN940_13816 [Castellaniella defragrans 65Phen]|uniref:Uncharacterized protein n=1 Tax=Castellaniella defragrans (strain DSM 12143 / CCUG 39792 / 65Phen) TaxID=1437824 RepID=W8X032_CASD6|nr:hypothetical protein BN940_13816 [Castellaniella defragrans 65Phen]